MGKTCVGIDIGASDVKFAVVTDNSIRNLAIGTVPDSLVREGRIVSPELAAEFLKIALKNAQINLTNCAFLLPSAVAYTRSMMMPAMSHDNLILNLPYEFRDFITMDKEKYFYDYAMLDTVADESGKVSELEIIAATTLKDTIRGYGNICRRAGVKLRTAVPEEIAYMNILNKYKQRNNVDIGEREFAFIDIGHTSTRLHIYKGNKHQASRVIEYGVGLLDSIIAEQYSIDEHTARAYKHANTKDEQNSELCYNLYGNITMELTRALNFYRFNMPDSNLTDIYFCGGGSRITPLIDRLHDELQLNICSFSELLPDTMKNADDAQLCHLAIGVAMQ